MDEEKKTNRMIKQQEAHLLKKVEENPIPYAEAGSSMNNATNPYTEGSAGSSLATALPGSVSDIFLRTIYS